MEPTTAHDMLRPVKHNAVCSRLALSVAAAILVLPAQQVFAAKWTIKPSITLSGQYTDNVALAPSGLENDDFITQINPSLVLSTNGPRLTANVDYRMQNFIYQDTSPNRTYSQLDASANFAAVKNLFYLDFGGNMGQQAISPSGTIGFDNSAVTSNRTNVRQFYISPYLQKQFGQTAQATLRYRFTSVRYDAASVSSADSDNDYILAELISGPRFNRLAWTIRLEDTRINRDQFADSEFRRGVLDLRYKLTGKIGLVGSAGYEDNDFPQFNPNAKSSGSLWTAGFEWRPARRSSLEMRGGERYFGSTAMVLAKLQTRRSEWEASYNEDYTTSSLLSSASLGTPAPTPVTPVVGDTPQITSEIILSKRGSISYLLRGARSDLGFYVYNDDREFQATNENERVYGVDAHLNWGFMPRTTAEFLVTRSTREFRDNVRVDDITGLRLGVSRQIRRKVKGGIYYTYIKRDSTSAANEYKSNALAVSVTVDF